MFRKSLFPLFIAALAASSALAFQGTKIGIVNADDVIQGSAKGKAFFDELETFTKTKREEIEKLAAEYQAKEGDLRAKAASMSDEKRQESGLDLQRLQTEIKRKQEDAQQERDLLIKTKFDNFRKELAPLIRQVALERGLDLVLNHGPQSNLVYSSDSIDITGDVIKKFDETAK